MTLLDAMKEELQMEAETTRKMLSIVPADKFTWKPHPKSMDLLTLATHVAELNSWIPLAMNTTELDFAKEGYNPQKFTTTQEIVDLFEKNTADAKKELDNADTNKFGERWLLRTGEEIHVDTTKYGMMRVSLSQTIHHRAQLGVFLRLLNVPIPGSYGPSADELNFM